MPARSHQAEGISTVTETPEFQPKFTGSGATMFGTYFPRHYVVTVIPDRERPEQAVADLRADGFASDDVELWSGEQVLANHEPYLAQHGLRERLGRLFPGEESEVLEEYLEEARNGANFVTVRAPDEEPRGRAAAILKGHLGHAMRYYAKYTFTDL